MGGSLVVQAAASTATITSLKTKPAKNVIIIAVDESPQAETAFNWYVKYVHAPGNFVKLTHCRQPIGFENLAEDRRIKGPRYEAMMTEAKQNAKSLIEQYEARMAANEVEGDVEIVFGHAGESIVQASKEHQANMIIMGTRGFGVIKRAIVGSVSFYVLGHADIPVTVVPHDETRYSTSTDD